MKCEAETILRFTELTDRLLQEKQFLFVVHKKSCSEAGRRHFWRFVSVDKFLSASRQVGRTWRGQLMTGIWRIFWLSKQTCLSFVSSVTHALVMSFTIETNIYYKSNHRCSTQSRTIHSYKSICFTAAITEENVIMGNCSSQSKGNHNNYSNLWTTRAS